jgi:hypothetical protein
MPDVTVADMFGKTVNVEGNGVATVKDALAHFYKGAGNIPTALKVQIGGREATLDTPVRQNDVIIVRDGQLARKGAISGATCIRIV